MLPQHSHKAAGGVITDQPARVHANTADAAAPEFAAIQFGCVGAQRLHQLSCADRRVLDGTKRLCPALPAFCEVRENRLGEAFGEIRTIGRPGNGSVVVMNKQPVGDGGFV